MVDFLIPYLILVLWLESAIYIYIYIYIYISVSIPIHIAISVIKLYFQLGLLIVKESQSEVAIPVLSTAVCLLRLHKERALQSPVGLFLLWLPFNLLRKDDSKDYC